MIRLCNSIIEYSFYGLFLLVPLAFTSSTSELFELNKMWLTWALTIIIGASWFVKMILQRKFFIQRTPLDIPIVLFLTSQIISTIFSQDVHVSLWGYYSRFNGGLLSIATYIFLYYSFLSNFRIDNASNSHEKRESVREFRETISDFGEIHAIQMVKRLLSISLLSGLVVALWGLPSHFGFDPTCLIFRGTFDVSCWTADFMPKIRIFSTLGQPDWLAAYLAILIPISIALTLTKIQSSSSSQIKKHESGIMNHVLSRKFIHNSLFIILTSLFYVDLLFTRARSGVLGVWFSLIFFFVAYFWMERKKLKFSILNSQFSVLVGIFLITTFLIGTPINQLRSFTLEGIGNYFQKNQIQKTSKKTAAPTPTPVQSFESGGPARRSSPKANYGGTESGNIRLNVWTGAINAWKNNPIFGTGVETFAFAYYKYKPVEHNLTSEWNFLYNKAHNEYLNYLATTGIVGLGTYLGMIGFFLTTVMLNLFQHLNRSRNETLKQVQGDTNKPLILALVAGYISILATNFFGFSVVITNIYLFMIPAFVFILTGMIKHESGIKNPHNAFASRGKYESRNLYQWTFIFCIILASLFMILTLKRFWQADIAYALGYNLDRAGEYQNAYPHLHKAVQFRGDEPVFKDELSINDAIIAAALLAQQPANPQKEQTISVASGLAQEAISTSDEIISKHSNNVIFWKTRVRLFYTLSQIDSSYLPKALEGIEKASILAPADANIWYNLGVLYGQNNNIKKGIEALEKTVQLKPDYRDARYALGLFYHTASQDSTGKVVINFSLQKKALDQMRYILNYIASNDSGALESIKNWK